MTRNCSRHRDCVSPPSAGAPGSQDSVGKRSAPSAISREVACSPVALAAALRAQVPVLALLRHVWASLTAPATVGPHPRSRRISGKESSARRDGRPRCHRRGHRRPAADRQPIRSRGRARLRADASAELARLEGPALDHYRPDVDGAALRHRWRRRQVPAGRASTDRRSRSLCRPSTRSESTARSAVGFSSPTPRSSTRRRASSPSCSQSPTRLNGACADREQALAARATERPR